MRKFGARTTTGILLSLFFWRQVWPEPRGGCAAQPGQHHRPTELTAGAAVRRALRQPASLRLLVLPAAARLDLSWLPHQARQRTIAPLAADTWITFWHNSAFKHTSTLEKSSQYASQQIAIPHIFLWFIRKLQIRKLLQNTSQLCLKIVLKVVFYMIFYNIQI